MSRIGDAVRQINRRIDNRIYKTLEKYNFTPFADQTTQMSQYGGEDSPVYERQISPFVIKELAESEALINNAIEEKVNQAFRRGFTDWIKLYEAKCPNCNEEFQSKQPFIDQLGGSEVDDEISRDEVDLDTPRPCPNCGEVVKMKAPSDKEKSKANDFFERANERDNATELIADRQNSVSQTFIGVCREVANDIQMFDNGWMLFDRQYSLDEEGNVVDWDLQGVFRAPPWLMRYSVSDEGRMGGEYWVCLSCRAKQNGYSPQEKPGPCDHCENRTYEVYAYSLDGPQGSPVNYYVNGEFVHDSEYRPSRFYGLPPIVSLIDEARSLDKMDEWYREAYTNRRAPRGAMVIQGSNQEAVRSWNKQQMEKLNADPNHIPTFIDDTDGSGQPISWTPLLENPAEMQNMEMRRWYKDRISAKFGVTAIFQSASSSSTGMSQSQEILVSNRSAERLQNVFEESFIPAFLGNLQINGWDKKLRPPEEEDEQAEEQLKGRKLQNLRTASDLGFDVEWTGEGEAIVRADVIEAPDEEDDGGGLGGLFGSDPTPEDSAVDSEDNEDTSNPSDRPTADEDGIDPAGTTSTSGGRPEDPNERGGEPTDQEKPSTEDPIARGDTVTSGTAGYSNATFGGQPGETIDILEELEEEEDGETEKSLERLRRSYNECVSKSDYVLPEFGEIERSVKHSPDTDWRAFKRRRGDAWTEYVKSEQFVKRVYEFMEDQHE